MKQEVKKERGSVVVEAAFTLPIFIIAMFFFINLINIFILHNKVQFAINSAAHEIAAYSYVYQKTDLRAAESKIQDDGKKYTEKIDETIGSVVKAIDNVKNTISSVKKTYEKAMETVDSAKKVMDDVGTVFENVKSVAENVENLKNTVEDLPYETKKSIEDVKDRIENAKTEFMNSINNVKNITQSTNPGEALNNAKSIMESGKITKDELVKIKEAVNEYLGKVEKVREDAEKIYESAQNTIQSARDVKDGIEDVANSAKGTIEEGKATIEKGKEAAGSIKTAFGNAVDRIKNMKETLIGGGFMAAEGTAYLLKNKVGGALYRITTKKYLDDAYLRAYGVSGGYNGLNFVQSTYLNDDKKRMIDIMVSYEVNLTPFKIIITDKSLLHLKVTQRVTVPAWVDGDGREKKEWKAVK